MINHKGGPQRYVSHLKHNGSHILTFENGSVYACKCSILLNYKNQLLISMNKPFACWCNLVSKKAPKSHFKPIKQLKV